MITPLFTDSFPATLRNIHNPPKKLYLRGTLPSTIDDYKFLCVIGARKHSDYGFDACRHLIQGLAGYPISIVSGLAIGMDSIAHQAALDVGLHTIAFPGSGLDWASLYPFSKHALAKDIIAHGGALVSEFEAGQLGTHWTFPSRNRLMAGISHATLIVEARHGSGTLRTAEYALNFGRDVLAVPGSIFSELSYGSHMLLSRGATPISHSRDILQALGFETAPAIPEQSRMKILEYTLTELEQRIVDCLQLNSQSGSDLIEKTQLTSSEFNMIISELELKGLVKETSGIYARLF